MATLVFGERRVEVTNELVLGREGDVQIEDEEVSRRHARVRPMGDGVEIEDLGSRNGTFVNDRRITSPVRLTEADEVRLGHTTIRVQTGARAGATVISSSDKLSQAPFAPPQAARARRAPASRLLLPQVVAYVVVVATAVALLLYFGLR